MYSNDEIRQSQHQDIKAQNRVKMRHVTTSQSVTRAPKMPKGMTGYSLDERFECRRVSEGDESQNIRQVYHF